LIYGINQSGDGEGLQNFGLRLRINEVGGLRKFYNFLVSVKSSSLIGTYLKNNIEGCKVMIFPFAGFFFLRYPLLPFDRDIK
jgi:hypothetical protein